MEHNWCKLARCDPLLHILEQYLQKHLKLHIFSDIYFKDQWLQTSGAFGHILKAYFLQSCAGHGLILIRKKAFGILITAGSSERRIRIERTAAEFWDRALAMTRGGFLLIALCGWCCWLLAWSLPGVSVLFFASPPFPLSRMSQVNLWEWTIGPWLLCPAVAHRESIAL